MKCKNCGTDNAPMTAYCGVCGAPLEGNEFQQVPDNTSVENYSESPKKKKKGLKIAIIIISVVLVLTLGIVAVIGVGIAAVIGLYNVDASEDIYSPDAYEESIGGDIFDEEFDFGELNPEENENNYDSSYTDDYSYTLDFADYLGYYYTIDGYKENGPCYCVDLLSYDSVSKRTVFSVEYVGLNASPYYSTGSVIVELDENNSSDFQWTDTWGNSGTGNIRLVDGTEPTIKLEMVQTETAEFNRYSLQTGGTIELYYGE